MGYYMRFYDTDPRPLHFTELLAGLREIDPAFDIDGGFLLYAGEWHGEITIDAPKSAYFDSDTEMLKAELADATGTARKRVETVLRNAQREVCVRVLWGGRDSETTLSRLDMLWDWLFAHRNGLLHAEGEGFYEGETLILAAK